MIKQKYGQSWYCCPYCKKALFPVYPETKIRNMFYRCKACKRDMKIDID